jgi:hypothetical protein
LYYNRNLPHTDKSPSSIWLDREITFSSGSCHIPS